MKISRFSLNAAAHTRGTGAISGSVPCALDCEELAEAVRVPVRILFFFFFFFNSILASLTWAIGRCYKRSGTGTGWYSS